MSLRLLIIVSIFAVLGGALLGWLARGWFSPVIVNKTETETIVKRDTLYTPGPVRFVELPVEPSNSPDAVECVLTGANENPDTDTSPPEITAQNEPETGLTANSYNLRVGQDDPEFDGVITANVLGQIKHWNLTYTVTPRTIVEYITETERITRTVYPHRINLLGGVRSDLEKLTPVFGAMYIRPSGRSVSYQFHFDGAHVVTVSNPIF